MLPEHAIADVIERFAAKSEWRGACLVWTGATDADGYGQTSVRGVKGRVHRFAWIERHGPIPAETPFVLHHCDNPPCWRDEHLFLGDHPTNMADMVAKGRAVATHGSETHCPAGHEYGGENLRVLVSGGRSCRECERAGRRRRYAESKGTPVRPYDRSRRLFRQNPGTS